MFVVEREFYGKKLRIETGRVAKQAAGSALVSYGESVVLVNHRLPIERKAEA